MRGEVWSAQRSGRQAVSSKKLSFEKIRATLDRVPESMADIEAKVGYHEGVSYPAEDGGAPISYVASIMEYGAPARKIPPRPTMGPTIRKNEKAYVELLRKGTKQVLAGKMSGEDAIKIAGDQCAGDIRKAIASLTGPALSPVTIMLRGMKSNGVKVSGKTVGEAVQRVADGKTNYGASSKPLIDTGIMQASCTSEVGKK